MSETAIRETIVYALKQRFGVPAEVISQLDWDTHLCGSPLYFSDVNLVYLFYEVERLFGIRITEENLQKNGFRSLREICAAAADAQICSA